MKIVVCRFGQKESGATSHDPLLAAGADFVADTLIQARNYLLGLLPVLAQTERVSPMPAARTAVMAKAQAA